MLKEKSITSYTLIKKMNVQESLLYRMRKNKPMTTTTLDDLCRILDCKVEDILQHVPDKENRK